MPDDLTKHLMRLADLLEGRVDTIIGAWKDEVARTMRRALDESPVTNSLSDLIRELAENLRNAKSGRAQKDKFGQAPIEHATRCVKAGLDIEEVIIEYSVLRDVLQDQAEAAGLNLTGRVGHIVNSLLNIAMTLAICAYVREHEAEASRMRQERLSFVMHDLKTPLSAIMPAAAVLEPYYARNRDDIDIIEIIHRNAERMNSLLIRVVREERYLNSVPILECRDFNLGETVGSLITELKPLSDRVQTELRNDVNRDMTIVADAPLMAEVFQNLISNAIRYTHHGRISVGAQRIGNTVECWVEDSGKGIEPERIERIFEKFETDSNEGQGLGLAIVKKIIEAHGGNVGVTSEFGKGSRFYFVIPQASERIFSRAGIRG